MKLTDRQASILKRLEKNGGHDFVSPDVAKQLEKKGLIRITGKKHQREEWGRKVKGTILWEVYGPIWSK